MRRLAGALLGVLLFASPAWATCILKQSTAFGLAMGPFTDSAGAVQTGLTLSQADVQLKKGEGAFAQKNDATSCTHEVSGHYECPLNTTDTGTTGLLRVVIQESGSLPVWRDCEVLTASAYDARLSGTAAPTVVYGGAIKKGAQNVSLIVPITSVTGAPLTGLVFNAAGLKARYGRHDLGNADFSTLTLVAGTRGSHAPGGLVESDAADGAGMYQLDLSDAMVAVGADRLSIYLSGAANMVPTIIWVDLFDVGAEDNAVVLGTPVTTISGDIAGVQADTDNIQTRLPAALVSGRMDSDVGAMQPGVITGTVIATDAIGADEISSAAASEISASILGTSLSELAQATPPETPTVAQAIMTLYMVLRNQTVTTSSGGTPVLIEYTNNAGTVIFKCTLADNGTSFTKSECVSGP